MSEFEHVFEPATDPAAPPLLLLHGTGGDQHDLLPLGRALAPGAALLSPLGKVSEHGAPRFFRRLAEGVFDQQDLAFRTEELASFLASSSARYGFDRQRLVAVGFSNGANIAASLLLRHPDGLAGAALLRAMVPFEPNPVPALDSKPILLLSGVSDPIVPKTNANELAGFFRAGHADVTHHWTNAGHGLSQEDLSVAKEWLRRFYQK